MNRTNLRNIDATSAGMGAGIEKAAIGLNGLEDQRECNMSAGTEPRNAKNLPGTLGRQMGGTVEASGETETRFLAALVAIVRHRRSVRAYSAERIPDSILNDCFDLAILAPTSQNLECWQMSEVRDTVRLTALRHLCLDQPAAHDRPATSLGGCASCRLSDASRRS